MRMQEIQSRFGNSSVNTYSSSGGAGFTPVGLSKDNTSSLTGVTFEKLLATKVQEKENLNVSPAQVKKTALKSHALSSGSSDYDEIIKEASQKYGVEENFLKAIIQQESGFNPNATSYVGAMGLMQLMPETAKELGVTNAYDPRDNIMGGAKYISQQLKRFNGDKRKALAAYNAGPGAVLKYGGVPPYSETQKYVANIMSIYESMDNSS